MVQDFDEELMQEALGLKPKQLLLSKHALTASDMRMALAKDDGPSSSSSSAGNKGKGKDGSKAVDSGGGLDEMEGEVLIY